MNTEAAFISYQHTADEPADVTFNLKDFKVMLGWCMSMDMDMAIRFQSPGAPLLVEPYCGQGVIFNACRTYCDSLPDASSVDLMHSTLSLSVSVRLSRDK